ncbi:MAG: hypothetical protein P1U89_17895 [Verrucomicrobiales bacterium]|nr:hypothetical protein [Verrucomicrobiales bacterium]
MRGWFRLVMLSKKEAAFFFIGLCFTVFVLIRLYNHFWYPPDDGAYAHVADRLLSGEVLNRDVQDVHMGYINFCNAISLKWFGNNMASLRIPLAVCGILQAALIFFLLRGRGAQVALTGMILLTSLSFIQFLNPTANWYGLFITVVIIAVLYWVPSDTKWKCLLTGFLLITLFLFRQLSGIFVSIGVVTYLLFNEERVDDLRRSYLSKFIFLIMAVGLAGYLVKKTTLSAILLFGMVPVCILVCGMLFGSASNRRVIAILSRLLAGGVIGIVPLVVYHTYHGSISNWFHDTVYSALSLTELSFIRGPSFLDNAIFCILSTIQDPSFDVILNGVFWLSLMFAPMVLGLLVIKMTRNQGGVDWKLAPLPVIAVFYALVSAHFQIPIYLFYTSGLTLCGILWFLNFTNRLKKNLAIGVAVIIAVTGVYYHAAQPVDRPLNDVLQGVRDSREKEFFEGNVKLWITREDARDFGYLTELVNKHVAIDESIFAFPSDSELYYLTERTNPFRFFNSSFGVPNQQALDEILSKLEKDPPRMVFFAPNDKYNTDASLEIAEYIKIHYDLIESVNGLDCYLYQSEQ